MDSIIITVNTLTLGIPWTRNDNPRFESDKIEDSGISIHTKATTRLKEWKVDT